MSVTMTPHSWQQTQNYIRWKLVENVAYKWQKMAISGFLIKSAFFEERKMAFLVAESFAAYSSLIKL